MRQTNNIFLNEIVPLIKVSLFKNRSFSYASEEKLATGTLVEIPFSGRKREGVVLESYLTQEKELKRGFPIKKIGKIIAQEFLNEKQLQLADFLADYYFASLGFVLKLFVPMQVKIRKKNVLEFPTGGKKVILTQAQKKAIKKILKGKKSRFLLFGPSGSGKTEVYIQTIAKLKSQDTQSQFLILLPEVGLTPQALERYGAYFSREEMTVLNSQISKGQFYADWEKIRLGAAKIIIGSRMAIFAPFKNLKLVIVDEEQDISYKQWDMHPRYDARKLAEKLAEIHQAKIIYGSASPRVETYFQALKTGGELVTIPYFGNIDEKKLLSQTVLVDMKKELWEKNPSLLSRRIREEINWTLKNKRQILLFVSRQGLSNFSVCLNCKEVFRCPHCDRALVGDKEGNYQCLHCAYKTEIIPKCFNCGSLNFNNVGGGTQRVEKEILNFFPQAKILRADSQTTQRKNTLEKIYEKFSSGQADILIGTQMVSKGWDLPKVSLVGIMDSDNLLSLPDFFAFERAFQTIFQVSGRTNRPHSQRPGKVIIQTFHPENFIFQLAIQRDYVGFFKKEIEERKEIGLPPFGRIVKLTYQDYSLQKVQKEGEKMFALLEKRKDPKIKIFAPQSPLLEKIRGRFRKQIIIRLKGGQTEFSQFYLKNIFQNLPKGWAIDVDPISLV